MSSSTVCLHLDIDKDGTCMECGECNIKPEKWQDMRRRSDRSRHKPPNRRPPPRRF